MSAEKDTAPKTKLKIFLENLVSLSVAVVLVFMVRSSVIEAFKIPSGSMIPTLLIGDHIFVNKFAYGLKIPFTEWFMEEPIYLYRGSPPARGDIIVFKFPNSSGGKTVYFIKRVVGVPGDTIELKEKRLLVNGSPVGLTPLSSERFEKIKPVIDENAYSLNNLKIFDEKIDSTEHLMMTDSSNGSTGFFGPITVPPDSLFVMGDNRDHSNDSRFWGFVPMRNVKGRAFVIWLSVWMDFDKDEYSFKPSRMGTILR